MLLLPLLVKGLLIRGEQRSYLSICVVIDLAAGAAFGAGIARGIIAKTIEGDVPGDEDHLHLGNLVFGEI